MAVDLLNKGFIPIIPDEKQVIQKSYSQTNLQKTMPQKDSVSFSGNNSAAQKRGLRIISKILGITPNEAAQRLVQIFNADKFNLLSPKKVNLIKTTLAQFLKLDPKQATAEQIKNAYYSQTKELSFKDESKFVTQMLMSMFNNPIWKKGSNKAHKITNAVGVSPRVGENEDIVKILFGIVSKNDEKVEAAIKAGNGNILQLGNTLDIAQKTAISQSLERKGIEADIAKALKKGADLGILTSKEKKLKQPDLIELLMKKKLLTIEELAPEQKKVIESFEGSLGSQPQSTKKGFFSAVNKLFGS